MSQNNIISTFDQVKLKLSFLALLLEIMAYSALRPLFWWLRLRGRHEAIQPIVERIVLGWAEGVFRRLRVNIEVEGIENIPPTGPVVVMANHQNMFDIVILLSKLGRIAGFVAKKELFRIPGFQYWMKRIGCISLDRSDPRSAGRLYREISKKIKEEGNCLVMFPEGTRTDDPDGKIAPFKEGSLRLAALEKIPILPVSIDGTRFLGDPAAMRRTRKGGRLIRLKIAPVIIPDINSAKERRELMAEIRQVIVSGFEEIHLTWPAFQEPKPTETANIST